MAASSGAVGKTVRLGTRDFRIVGVLEPSAGDTGMQAIVALGASELGVRKSVGAGRRTIVAQFLAESVAISLAGSIIGVLLGLAGAFGVRAIMRMQTEARIYAAITWSTVGVSLLAALAVGLIFGTYPALRAARLSPIDALRYE